MKPKFLEDSIKKAKMSKEAEEKCFAELKKLRMMSPMSAESTVVRNYLRVDGCFAMAKVSKVNTDINVAQKVLDKIIMVLKR